MGAVHLAADDFFHVPDADVGVAGAASDDDAGSTRSFDVLEANAGDGCDGVVEGVAGVGAGLRRREAP